jgi:hypothetical protein
MPEEEKTARGKKISPRCIEYWIDRFDMNPESAKLMVSNYQSDVSKSCTDNSKKKK